MIDKFFSILLPFICLYPTGNVDALLKPASTTITSGQFSQENISSNSYASVVSRRKEGDLLNIENELVNVSDNLAKLALSTTSSTPAMSTLEKKKGNDQRSL